MTLRPLALACIALAAAPAFAAVTVEYGNPDRFTDAGDRNTDPVKVMKLLADRLKALGDKELPAGTDVKITVHDLDRAGRTRMNLPTEMRVLSGKADPPCMMLSYAVTVNGQPGESRKERVCDTDYLRPLGVGYTENDPLVYEKRMLDEWFRARFVPPRGR
jgi:DUF3016 family protein